MQNNITGLAGWIKNSFINYPRTVSTVLFFSGCNLRCPYCHNGHLITSPQDLSNQSDTLWNFLEKRKNIIDGVVITGGEPTLYPNIKHTLAEIRNMGYRIKLDTNGLLPDVIKEFAPDYLALDIKTTPYLYSSLLKSTYENVAQRLAQSIEIVKKMKKNAEIRITVAPGLISMESISIIKKMISGVTQIYLQRVSLGKDVLSPSFFESKTLPTVDEIKNYQKVLKTDCEYCTIRNE